MTKKPQSSQSNAVYRRPRCRHRGEKHLVAWSRRSRTGHAAVIMPLMVLIAGCADDDIRHYKARRLEQMPATKSRVIAGDARLLAAIVPHEERTWFFKLVGPAAAVTGEATRFESFIRSVRFGGSKEIEWDVPEGWQQQPGSAMRYATFQIETANSAALELTVVPLPGGAGSVIDNVNRWRNNDLGLPPIEESEMESIIRTVELKSVVATIVDMTATRSAALPPGHPPVDGAGPQAQASPPVKYDIPPNWREVPSQKPFRVASLEVRSDDQLADVSISVLSGNAGGLLANVNRWRSEQLGLDTIDEAQLQKALREIEVAGKSAHFVELVGPESAGDKRQSILCAILERDGNTWFFKMTGPAALVAAQKEAFDRFVRSVQF